VHYIVVTRGCYCALCACGEVFKHHNDWWEEFRLYHRKDGKVVKEGDDLMCATRYALMMIRHASTTKSGRAPRPHSVKKKRCSGHQSHPRRGCRRGQR
jgi:hypothetical protein